MICSQCQADNQANRKFCGACGHPLSWGCGNCGFVNEGNDRFCGGCGSRRTLQSTVQGQQSKARDDRTARRPTLDPQPVSYTPAHLADRIRAVTVTDGERKTITALFADLKGSTALIEGLDPEDARALIDPALQLMMDAVHRYDGYVAQALGDGIFALFGAPIAHEDHPQRALYAALRMQEAMRRYSDKLREGGAAPLQMRVGINTGEVVVRSIRKDDLHADYVPVGHSTNIAARMEQLANPGAILVTEATHKLTDGYFAFTALGQTKVKGIEAPVPIYEVTGAGPLRTRFQVTARRGLTRFVGRHSELDQMRRALEQAKAGHGQIVGVMGEPGLGKSRLFYEFKLTAQTGCLVLEAFSVSHGKVSPYWPLIELLKTYFQIEPTDEERLRKEKVTGRVLTLDRHLEDTLPYLFSLLGVEDPASSLQQMDAQVRRQRTFAALKKLFLRESLTQPLLLIFEDLHWIDSETQGFLSTLSESVASAPVLLLVNYRPEYRPEWGQKTYYTQLRLAPLGQAEAGELLTSLLGSDTSLSALKSLILEKTEGTPFFMEEVVQTLAEEGALSGERGHYRLATTPTELHISPTVQGVLAARIDRLTSDEKALLQQLAVIGRQFPLSLVKQVVAQPEAELYQVLSSLQAKEFLYEQPAFPESEYLFKHALTQDVAYGTVLQEQRKVLHERTGQATEALYHENLEDHYSDLAHHYQLSENAEKAVEYLSLAGQQAVQRSANEEAIRTLNSGLALLQSLPDTEGRDHQELLFLTQLGPAITVARGYTVPEVEHVYVRARELCQKIKDASQVYPVLWGLWYVYLSQGKHRIARELAEQCGSIADQSGRPDLVLEAHYALALTLFALGDIPTSHQHFEQVIALYEPEQHHSLTYIYGGQDPGVAGRTDTGSTLWQLGYPDQAGQRAQAGLALAHRLAHPFSLAFAYGIAGWSYAMQRDARAVQELAEATIALGREHGFPFWAAVGGMLRGWALAQHGRAEEGYTQGRQAMKEYQALGFEFIQPHFLILMTETCLKAGKRKDAELLLEEAFRMLERNEERWIEAELYRVKGLLMLTHDGKPTEITEQKEAEACFHKAIEVAHHQSTKSWELRAATSLARLWQHQSKTTEARELLALVYSWFTEGFDTADLKDAKSLLNELSEGV